MKKVNVALSYAAALVVLLSSCKDDAVEMEAGKTEMPATFSSFTSEQNKINLEDNGLELIGAMSDLKASSGIKTSATLVSFLDRSPAGPANGRVLSTARALKNLREGKASAYEVFTAMKATEEEPESIQAAFDMYVGVYEWNAEIEDWHYSKEGDMIVFKFPATEGGTENNAEFMIHSYTGVNVPNLVDDEYTGDLPTQLITELKVDGQKQIEYTFNAQYTEKGEPTQLTSTLAVNSFIFSISAENNTENIGVEYSLKNNDKILILLGAGAKGKFTTEHIESVEHSQTSNAGDVAEELNAYFQLMNVKIAGGLNIKKYADGYGEIYADNSHEDFDHNQATEAAAALLDENFNLVVFYNDSKEKIADTEVYTYTDTYTSHDVVYNEATGTYDWTEKEVEYTAMDIRMIFADESKSDLDTYFSDGFEDLSTEISKFVEELESGK